MDDLSWRKQEREGYIRLDRHLYAKKSDLDYFTEQDLIERYAKKRGFPREAIADLYRVFMLYLNKQLEENGDDEKGYYVRNLGYFLKKNLYVEDLTKASSSLKFKKAKKQLDLYMKTGTHYRLC